MMNVIISCKDYMSIIMMRYKITEYLYQKKKEIKDLSIPY